MTATGVVSEIKSKLPVLEVVSETVALKRAGSVYKGLCPFHAEKTPSFVVSPDREGWHCFGCDAGGDIFTFVMRRDGLEFREALVRLAEKAGVELSERSAQADRRSRRLREALEAAIAWYREVLLRTPQAAPARRYLAERGLEETTLDRFGIGFAPSTWDALTKRLRGRGFRDEELIGAGLASPSNRGGVIDKFRGRIIIPIRDQSARAIGLGGRILPGVDGPKYLNSPATALFDKSRTLFGIDLAKTAIRREKLAVIVEGYTDVMAAHQAGFGNVVASLGTALTAGQIELAKRYADGIALAYDVDLAGEAATQRGLLEELGPDQSVSKVRVVRIPAGKDPDELIRTDADAWRRAVADSKPVVEYFFERLAGELDLSSVEGRREMAGRGLALLQRIGDRLERELYIQQLARLVSTDERILREALQRPRSVRREASVVRPAPDAAEVSLPPLEAELLQLLLGHPALADALPAGPLPLSDSAAAALADIWLARVRVNPNGAPAATLDGFLDVLDPATREVARTLLARMRNIAPGTEVTDEEAPEALRVCLLRLRRARIEEAIREGRLLLEDAQREGDREQLERIEHQITQLGREKADVTRAMQAPAPVAGARRS
ncbi:MAG: DNA primase [Chloroflexi bacterium]|nr:MAG: DNA primase [Chloroflexota bacterium]